MTAPASWTLALAPNRPKPTRDRRRVEPSHIPTLTCMCGATATTLEAGIRHQFNHHPEENAMLRDPP